jgi:hypothetical protein
MTAEAGFTRSWPVGRYTATLTAQRPKPGSTASAVIEWAPNLPRKLTCDEIEDYRAGRHKALVELTQAFGISVGIVEV